MSIYKAIASPSDGRQITFPDSIHLIIEAMAPGNGIFDKSEEIRALAAAGVPSEKKIHTRPHLSGLCDQLDSEYIERAICN